jgi:hypothetical protein
MAATYAIRTCVSCGIRKPQPNMYQKEIYVETGKSQTGISGATWVGVFSGDTKSGTQVRNWLFNNGQRTYKRKRKVWMCGVCSGVDRPAKIETAETQKTASAVVQPKQEKMSRVAKWVWIIFALAMVSTCIDEIEKNKAGASKQALPDSSQSSP